MKYLKLLLYITIIWLLFFSIANNLQGQDLIKPVTWVTLIATDTTVVDTISAEEQFLKDISDAALLKDEKRKEFKQDLLTIAVVYLLVDKFFINKEGK